MRKLKLEIEELAVETFEPAADESERAGTVRAHDAEEMVASKPLSDCVWSLCQTCGIYC
ncbi:MAG TPA: hypothetical protein VF541_18540 [Longimicrobium sp.]|jgi:hypothetical protein